jgi:hypothetical protein
LPDGPEGRPVELRAEAAPLDPEDPRRRSVGPLRYGGGLMLSSPDPAFGGLSGLVVEPGGRLWAVSDRGWWFSARLLHERAGSLKGIADGRMGPLLGTGGLPLEGKRNADAEGLAAVQGGFLVSFERRHRLWLYPGPRGLAGVPRALRLPPWLAASPRNQGVEAVGVLAGGRLLLLAEQAAGEGHTWGALGDGRRWSRLRYPLGGGFRPTALAGLATGGCLVLERAYSLAAGARARLMHLPGAQIKAGAWLRPRLLAVLAPPLTTDNFEGLAVIPAPGGGLSLYLISDDNFSPVQRTLLLRFELPRPPAP